MSELVQIARRAIFWGSLLGGIIAAAAAPATPAAAAPVLSGGARAALSALAPAALAPAADSALKPPSVTTGATPLVSTSEATLKGMVNPHGAETSYFFQYGPTTAYGSQTSTAAAGAGTEVKVSQVVTGLQPGTTYHFRLVAMNAYGTTEGQDVAFATKKIPLTFKLSPTPNPDVFGRPFSVSGVLSGTGSADHEVVLQTDPFPYTVGFANLGPPVTTDATGAFSLPVEHLPRNAELRVATLDTPPVKSALILERVAVRVSLHVRSTGRPGFVRLYGDIAPGEAGARVSFQLLRSGRPSLEVARVVIKHASGSGSASRYSRVVHIHPGALYRAFVQLSAHRLESGHSLPILIR